MFNFDEKLRGIPVPKEQVVLLQTSVNAPHLAIPGKQPGSAQAFIVGVRLGSGLALFIYLQLPQAGDCAVYSSGRRNLAADELVAEEQDALGFVESMGFMMENMHFRDLSPEQQEELVRSLPVFQKEPKPPAPPAAAKKEESQKSSPAALARLFASF